MDPAGRGCDGGHGRREVFLFVFNGAVRADKDMIERALSDLVGDTVGREAEGTEKGDGGSHDKVLLKNLVTDSSSFAQHQLYLQLDQAQTSFGGLHRKNSSEMQLWGC